MAAPDQTFRTAPALALRTVGTGCLWLLAALVLRLLDPTLAASSRSVARTLTWVFLVVGIGIICFGIFLLLDKRPRLRLTSTGFTNRTTRHPGVREVTWTDVTDVGRARIPGGEALVVRLSDGRSSVIAGKTLDARLVDVEAHVRQRLNDAHGYRPWTGGRADRPRRPGQPGKSRQSGQPRQPGKPAERPASGPGPEPSD